MLTTPQLRTVWGPPCKMTSTRVVLYGGAPITVDHRTKEAFEALSKCLEDHDYSAQTSPPTTGAYNCRAITGGTGYSLHAYGIAVDVRWAENPYQRPYQYADGLETTMPSAMVNEILALRTQNGAQVFRWGGDYAGNKDPMHFEIVCTPSDLAAGIAHHEPAPKTPDPARPQEDDDDMVTLAATSAKPPVGFQPNALYACWGLYHQYLDGPAAAAYHSVGTTDLGVNDTWIALHTLEAPAPKVPVA